MDEAIIDRLETALKDTGISRQEVVSRIEIGAQNAALERQWLSRDLSAIAQTSGLDLSKRDDLEKAVDQLHGELGRVLGEAQVLRDAGSADQLNSEHRPVESLPPVASEILHRLRQDPTVESFKDKTERDALRGEITNLLGED